MSATIINLTPHPVTLFPAHTPDRIEPGNVAPTRIIPSATDYPPARLAQRVQPNTLTEIAGVPVESVQFNTDPGCASTLPEPADGTWYIVPLAVAITAAQRHDLLVVHDCVRLPHGRIIGYRKLASPHH